MEIGNISSVDLAATWAGETLSAKNRLTTTDAKLVEDVFEQRFLVLAPFEATELTDNSVPGPRTPVAVSGPQQTSSPENGDTGQANGIDKSVLAVAVPRRYRNREHLRYVARQACLVCGRKQSDPHHLRYLQPRALGGKASDEFVVPLCRTHHRAVHRVGDEAAWWQAAGIDPIKVALMLWKKTRGTNEQKTSPLQEIPSRIPQEIAQIDADAKK